MKTSIMNIFLAQWVDSTFENIFLNEYEAPISGS